jgi:hypothetical protein
VNAAHVGRGSLHCHSLVVIRSASFLNEVGARALGRHLGRILEMAESSPDRYTYEQKIVARFGGQHEFNLVIPEQPARQQEAANWGGLGPCFRKQIVGQPKQSGL